MCCFDARLAGSDQEVRNCKPIKWLTNLSVLAEALGRRCAKHTGQVWHRHGTLLRGLVMHATAFSPVLIHTVLEAIKKQMCSDGQLAAVDLKLGEPIPSELVVDIADEQTEKWCDATSRPGQEGRARRNLLGERSISITGHPEPKRRRDEYPLCWFDGTWWTRSTRVDQTSDAGWLAGNSRRRPRNCRWHMNFSAR